MIHGIDPRHREQAQALRKARTNRRITLAFKAVAATTMVGIILAVIL